jgi:hypothetical protein
MVNKKYSISSQDEAIKHFMEQMDIEMVDAFLEGNITYQDMDKQIFLSKLDRVFEAFKESGDAFLMSFSGSCNSCDKNKQGFTFVGNYSFNYISIIFDSENGTINDMYECSSFINEDQSLILNKKLYIDNFVFDF